MLVIYLNIKLYSKCVIYKTNWKTILNPSFAYYRLVILHRLCEFQQVFFYLNIRSKQNLHYCDSFMYRIIYILLKQFVSNFLDIFKIISVIHCFLYNCKDITYIYNFSTFCVFCKLQTDQLQVCCIHYYKAVSVLSASWHFFIHFEVLEALSTWITGKHCYWMLIARTENILS